METDFKASHENSKYASTFQNEQKNKLREIGLEILAQLNNEEFFDFFCDLFSHSENRNYFCLCATCSFSFDEHGGVYGECAVDELDLIEFYLEAKRFQSPAGKSDVEKFVATMMTKNKRFGVLVNLKGFSEAAYDVARHGAANIKLIDGIALADFAFKKNLLPV